MKKIIISAAIAVMLIGGYVVGQSQLTTSSATKSNANADYVDTRSGSSGYGDVQTNSESVGSSTNSGAVDYNRSVEDKVMSAPGSVDVGDPLSKYIVKTGTIDITIDRNSLTEKYDKLVSIISKDGGYIEQDSSTQHSSTITVRIPSDKLDANLVTMRELGTVTARSLASQDQSYSVKDYETRKSILIQRKDVLVAALAKATAQETLNIQDQIFDVQGQIEEITAQQELLNEQISLATITVSLTEKGEKSAAEETDTKSLLGKSWEKASKSLLTSLGGIVIVIGTTFPFILLAIVVLITFKVVRKKKTTTK